MNSSPVHDPLKSNPCPKQKGKTARSGQRVYRCYLTLTRLLNFTIRLDSDKSSQLCFSRMVRELDVRKANTLDRGNLSCQKESV
jgi:hypothetical protein